MAVRGHQLHLAVDREESMGGREIDRAAGHALSGSFLDGQCPQPWSGRLVGAGTQDPLEPRLLRFLEPEYAQTPHLGDRARERAPAPVVRLMEGAGGRSTLGRRLLGGILRGLERVLPIDRNLREYIAAQNPDAVLLTPLVDVGSPRLEHFVAARNLGLRTALSVGGWDHLSSKSLLRGWPDAMIVWNDVQKREAVEMHGVPAERVFVTGAQSYDQWWDRSPSRSRASFCSRVGLRTDKPFVLRDIDLSGYGNVAFWGAHPVDAEAKDDYFDSMYFSAAVVGLNTSAFLEAACVGEPVHTVLVPGISTRNQEGTIHFHYLLTVNGGLLRTARSFDEARGAPG